jgi:hypothetical protein
MLIFKLFQVPYRVSLPRKVENLLVPGYSGGFFRVAPGAQWTSLGQTTSLAAHLSLAHRVPPARVDVAELQGLLHAARAATVYFSDVPRESPFFPIAQYYGTRGFFHSVIDLAKAVCQPQRPRFGLQYARRPLPRRGARHAHGRRPLGAPW